MYVLSFSPEVISNIVCYCDPKTSYPINKTWSKCTYDTMDKEIKQHSFIIAVEQGYTRLVEKVLPDINPHITYDDDWNSLCVASFYNHIDIIKILVKDKRINVNHYVNDNYTPLMIACDKGNIEAVIELFNSSNLDPNVQDSQGYTALMIACFEGHLNIVKFLLSNKRVNRKLKDFEGFTYLKHAREGGNHNMFRIIKSTKLM
jgi:ankyrin repeat protein